MRRRLLGACILLALAAGLAASWVVRATPQIRDRVVDALNERFASQVDLEWLDADIVPRPRVRGAGLTLRHNGRTDVPPLITITSFGASAGVAGLTRTPVHLRTVALEGLQIRVPVGGLRGGAPRDDTPHQAHDERPSPILIDTIESRSATLEIASGRPGRLPRIFQIHDLVMHGFGERGGARFEAGLTNPTPRGRIETTGVFGPWHADEPGLTQVSGEYTFKNADMNVIKGIGGTLASIGSYRGVLERVEVEGQTETPDFSIDISGNKVPLRPRFQAIVDGTNGDTFLERVEATLSESLIIASGSVVRTQEVKGRHITLDVEMKGARLEDLMRLAVKSATPPIVGRVDLSTKFLLPAGQEDVVDRLQLDGAFQLAQARFSNVNVQRQITTLSRRGRGQESDEGADAERVVSNLRGRFTLEDGTLAFQELMFAVPGSVVQLSGSYHLRNETMNFVGYLLTDATLADMTSGFKSLLARAAQPFFSRPGGGSRLPIRISGTREKPQFGLDVKRVFSKG